MPSTAAMIPAGASAQVDPAMATNTHRLACHPTSMPHPAGRRRWRHGRPSGRGVRGLRGGGGGGEAACAAVSLRHAGSRSQARGTPREITVHSRQEARRSIDHQAKHGGRHPDHAGLLGGNGDDRAPATSAFVEVRTQRLIASCSGLSLRIAGVAVLHKPPRSMVHAPTGFHADQARRQRRQRLAQRRGRHVWPQQHRLVGRIHATQRKRVLGQIDTEGCDASRGTSHSHGECGDARLRFPSGHMVIESP